jgi:pilus assembly protein CpaC
MESTVKRFGRNLLNQLPRSPEAVVLSLLCICGSMAVGAQQAASLSPAPPAIAGQLLSAETEQKAHEVLRVAVGHSVLIKTPTRVKRILTGNPAVLESVMTSPEEVVITAKQTGGSSLLLWGQDGEPRMIDVVADVDVGPLRDALERSYSGVGVEVHSQQDKIVLVGAVPTPAVADQMVKMAGNFSKEVVNGLRVADAPRQKQVMLKVRFAEADRNKLTAFGINLLSTGATNTIGTVSTQQFGAQSLSTQSQSGSLLGKLTQFNVSDLLNIFLFRSDINLGATIKDLQQKQVLQILAEPNLMAISGQPARFLAGGEFPYPVVQSLGGGVVGAVTIQFKPYGVKLEFVGTIQSDNSIRLKVIPEVSSLDYTNSVTISGFTMPAIQTRRAETEIELQDGQTFGIAGLLDERTTVQLSKVPGIADVPILGELFKSRNLNRSNTELLVLVTPTIVDPIAGPTPPSPLPVNMPVENLNNGEFDKGLPGAPKNPGAK